MAMDFGKMHELMKDIELALSTPTMQKSGLSGSVKELMGDAQLATLFAMQNCEYPLVSDETLLAAAKVTPEENAARELQQQANRAGRAMAHNFMSEIQKLEGFRPTNIEQQFMALAKELGCQGDTLEFAVKHLQIALEAIGAK